MEMEIGGVISSQTDLMAFLDMPVRGDATVILGYHYIAARLNVANGAESATIADALTSAQVILDEYGIGNRTIVRSDRTVALDAKDILAAYNELGCDDFVDGGEKDFNSFD